MSLAGCGSTETPATATTTTTTSAPTTSPVGEAQAVYVVQQPNLILKYSAMANANAPPLATLTVGGMTVTATFVDTTGQIYAAGTASIGGQDVIEVFAASASGSAAPVRTLSLGFLFDVPQSLWVDSGGLTYVVGHSGIVGVFSANASGTATPFRTIQGALTGLTDPVALTVDGTGNLYVANGNAAAGGGLIAVFPQTAAGNVAPARTIGVAGSSANITGLSLDAAGDLYVAMQSTAGTLPAIEVFAPGASGSAAPTVTISGPSTSLGAVLGVGLDGAGYVYVVNDALISGTLTPEVLVYSPGAQGNASPRFQILSSAWTSPGSGEVGVF